MASIPPNADLDELRGLLEPGSGYLAYFSDGNWVAVQLQREWTRIGRSHAADIRFDDPSVFRRHAMIVRQAEGYSLLDNRSLTGVFHNGERVEWARLADGDRITIGEHELVFLLPLPAESRGRTPATATEWRDHIGPVWTADQLLARFAPDDRPSFASKSTATALAHDVNAASESLVALRTRSGEYVFPEFQFDTDGEPYEAIKQIIRLFRGAGIDEWLTASWFCSPQESLDRLAPATWLHRGGEDDRVLEAARRSVGRLAR